MTEDFVRLVKGASPVPLDSLFDDWVYTNRSTGLVQQGRPMREVAAGYVPKILP